MILSVLSLSLGLNAAGSVAGYGSAKLEIIEKSKVGLFEGLSNSFASIAGVVGVSIVGFLNESFRSWVPVFFWIAFMFTIAGVAFRVFGHWSERIKISHF